MLKASTKARILKLYLCLFTGILLFATFYISKSASKNREMSSQNNAYVVSRGNNDVAIFTLSTAKPKWEYYDGGIGVDTLWLRLTEAETQHPTVRADIIRFYYFLMHNSSANNLTGEGSEFSFSAFDLHLRNFENIIVEKIEAPKRPGITQRLDHSLLPDEELHIIDDSSYDSLA